MDKTKLDFSLGDPIRPLRTIAAHAFRESGKSVRHYQVNDPIGRNPSQLVRGVLEPISQYFTARGIITPGYSVLTKSSMLMTGGGTTEAYEMVVRLLADDLENENKRRARLGLEPVGKPVIVMPTPTYGYFTHQPLAYGIGIETVERDLPNGGRLDLKTLHVALERIRAEGKRIVGFYDSNPHNPLGLVRGRDETEKLALLIRHHNERAIEDDDAAFRTLRQTKGEENSLFLGPSRWTGPASRIRIIDDMVYDGLHYKNETAPFSFAQLEDTFNDTFLLCGLSKAGLAGLRAGLLIGSRSDIDTLLYRQHLRAYFPPLPAMFALKSYFNDAAPFAGWRTGHLDRMNAEHRFAGQFMKALINGTDRCPDITAAEQARMIRLLCRHGSTKPEAQRLLQKGVANVRIITSPQAGFFHLIDFSGLKGRGYQNLNGMQDTIQNEVGIATLFAKNQVKCASGTWTMRHIDEMLVRVSFAAPLKDIIEFAQRVRLIARQTFKVRPEPANLSQDVFEAIPQTFSQPI